MLLSWELLEHGGGIQKKPKAAAQMRESFYFTFTCVSSYRGIS